MNPPYRDDATLTDNEPKSKPRYCDLCLGVSKTRAAQAFCRECEQFQCINCKKQHQNLPSSKHHSHLSVEEVILQEETRTWKYCDLCKLVDQVSAASKLCVECQNKLLCAECAQKHAINKATRYHNLEEEVTVNIRGEGKVCQSHGIVTDTNGAGHKQQKNQPEKALVCMVDMETEFFMRFFLLLYKCGTKVLRQILIWGLKKQNTTLEVFLLSQSHIICKTLPQYQRDVLYPKTSNQTDLQTDLDKWDISLLCQIILQYFERQLTSPEKAAVIKIREMRNAVCAHHPNAGLDRQTFYTLWSDLEIVITTIGYYMEEPDRAENNRSMRQLSRVKLDMNTVNQMTQHLEDTIVLGDSAQITVILGKESTIIPSLEGIKEAFTLGDKHSKLGTGVQLEIVIYGALNVCTDEQSIMYNAEKALVTACKKTSNIVEEAAERSLLETKIDKFKEEIEKTGVEIQDVDQGSIIFTFNCKSIASILGLLDLFESNQLQKQVTEIEEVLTDVIGHRVHLTAYLLRQPLLEALRTIHDSGKQFSEIPTGLEGLHHVVKAFVEDGISNHDLSKALSHCVGRSVALETPVDLNLLQHAICVTKEQLGRSRGVSAEKMESVNLATVEFRDKTTTEEKRENDGITAKHAIYQGPFTSGEELEPNEDHTATGEGRTYIATNDEKEQRQNIDRRLDKDRPGQPKVSAILADTVTLVWEQPSNFREENHYLISYSTDTSSNYNWKVYPIEAKYETAILTGLKTKTTYVFRVRAIYNDGEGPYSPNSLEITTTESLASRFLPEATKVQDDKYSPTTYRLPVTEIKAARDEKNKTKKYEICVPHKGYVKSKTILLVGATGTGKTTLVDGIVNYALGVSWNDSFRFTAVHPEESEEARLKNQALSQTDWITCYTINHEKGSRLKYQLHVLDTPGFGDTQGPNRDKKIATQLQGLFSQKEPKGVTYIDAICFLVKFPDARLTVSQKYVFESVLSLFGKDVENNICYLITFADKTNPPVLAAMKESNLPSGRNFMFNNSGLFARNENADSDAGQIFWDMGLDSFSEFFKHLNYAETRSLQQTKDVLDERQLLETAVSNLQPQIDLGMSKVVELEKEKSILKEHFPLKKDAKNFEYETEETKPQKRILPARKHEARCQNCYLICDETYTYTDNETREKRCRICPNKCPWKDHTDIQSMYEYIPVKVKKQYWNMQQKVEKVKGHPPSQDQIVEQLEEELRQLLARVEILMFAVKSCTDRLSEIALRRPNPLSIIGYIDLMIENEKLEQRPGFENRVLGLQEIRKRTDITEEYEKFSKEASKVLKEVGETKRIWFRSVFEKANNLMTEITTIT